VTDSDKHTSLLWLPYKINYSSKKVYFTGPRGVQNVKSAETFTPGSNVIKPNDI
jgi:hypothetical protein